jgi:hypothetical protein
VEGTRWVGGVIEKKIRKEKVEVRGIEPRASRMRSERSTI